MKFYRVAAIFKRHLYLNFFNATRLFSLLYWPFINIVIWGITSLWIQTMSQEAHIVSMLLSGLVLWQIVFRVNLETAKGLYQELLHSTLATLFSTPLTWAEWVAAMMLLGIVNMFLIFICSAITVWLLYGISLSVLGWNLIPYTLSLLVSGWFIGFFICGIIMHWGLKATDFIYIIGYLFAPFSAIFYPVDALPQRLQYISNALPTTAIFEAMRHTIQTGESAPQLVLMGFGLNAVYLAASLLFFYMMFERRKLFGFTRSY